MDRRLLIAMINACLGPYADSIKPEDYKLIVQEQMRRYGVRKKEFSPLPLSTPHGNCLLN